MRVPEVRAITKEKGVKVISSMRKEEFIRAVQRAEGHCDCFRAAATRQCDQVACLRRSDCSTL